MANFPLTPAGVPLRAETKLLTCVQDHFQLVSVPETCPPDLVSSRPGVLETNHTPFKNLFRLKTQRIPLGCRDLRPPQTPRWRNNNNLSASVYIIFNPNSNLHLKQLEHDTIKLPDEKTRIRVSTFAYFIPLRR